MATTADAELILKLYEMRREPVMRDARKFVVMDFNPKSEADLLAVQRGMGSQENAWWRQTVTYWEMASTLCLHGALDAELYFDANMEVIAVYTKFYELYKQATGVDFMPQTAKLIAKTESAQKRVENRKKAIARSAELAAANAAKA
ncbi:DUF4760 domain-containing protein [Terriglobus aquaticus]|uniref:Uncharacterized protein n=1 Tax=Terriglobus aquaticus TaxID=940139 RepID=A0ABW9KLF3_9BACT|nr:hypothetical protein [Terriglobus aquaticus]